VPTGTRIGFMYCGSDGEWHLGWLVDAAVSPTGGGAKPPIKVGAANGGVLTATR
jgi:hypothetical protein